jgi:hypothetical protein
LRARFLRSSELPQSDAKLHVISFVPPRFRRAADAPSTHV